MAELTKYSTLRDASRPPLERLLPLKFPISMYIETTNKCLFRCRYCPISLADYADIAGGYKTMTIPEFEKIAKDIQAGGKLKVLRFYFMGEPLLNPNLSKMIKIACEMDLAERTELTTNGYLLDEETSKAIIHSGLDYLRISISGVDADRHKFVTQTEFNVEKIYKNIKQFKQIRTEMKRTKPFLYVKMLDSLNDAENEKFIKLYQNVSDETIIEKPMNWNDYSDHDLIQATFGEKPKVNRDELYPYPKSVCPFPFYNLMVNVNGDITVCCVDWNKATMIGNAFESTIQSIWDGDEMRNFRRLQIERKRSLNPSCANCQFLFTVPDNLDNMPASKIQAILGS